MVAAVSVILGTLADASPTTHRAGDREHAHDGLGSRSVLIFSFTERCSINVRIGRPETVEVAEVSPHNSYRNEWFVISLVDELWNTADSWVNFLRRKGIGPSGRAFNRRAMLSTRPDVRDSDRKPDPATTAHPQLTGRHSPPTMGTDLLSRPQPARPFSPANCRLWKVFTARSVDEFKSPTESIDTSSAGKLAFSTFGAHRIRTKSHPRDRTADLTDSEEMINETHAGTMDTV